jgi:lauroyl/myristoyl acyltransferase
MKGPLPPPGDLARFLFWVKLRPWLRADRPARLRAALPLWRLQHRFAAADHALLGEELDRCFGALPAPAQANRIAAVYRAAFRAHAEELLLGSLDAQSTPLWMELRGTAHLDAALARGKGVVWVYPHAGPVMVMIAALAFRGYRYVQYAARGLPPAEVAAAHPELAPNPWRIAVRQAREAAEDRLPARFLTHHEPARALYRALANNEIVGIAYDGRIGNRWAPLPYLGRTALLNPGPWRLAASTGAAIVPAFCHAPEDGPSVCEIGPPILPDGPWEGLAAQSLAFHQAALRRYPEEIGLWLLHARQRSHIDDHPLFTDQAPPERWARWAPST